MATKTIGVREEVYERLRARKRDDESFTDLLDRLIDESEGDWRDGFGSLSTEEVESIRESATASRKRFNESAAERQAAAIDRFADSSDGDEGGDGSGRSDDDADSDETDPDDARIETGGSA
ncbi:antitoxin VapB family protein [Halorubrum trueperi]|uniref:Antitoxin VapB family protein n=1 Tax=Halorubrum trueperi TaxID=2004704 RepID=A0ABD5UHH5_9EURY